MKEEPHTMDLGNGVERESTRLLRTGGPILFTYFTLLVAGHASVLTGTPRSTMMALAGLTAVGSAVVSVSAHRRATWVQRNASHCLTVLGIAVALNGAVHLTMVPVPVQTTNLMLVLVTSALFLTQRAGLALVYTITGAAFSSVVVTHPSPDWVHFGFALFATAVLGVALTLSRERNRRYLHRASNDERHARGSLELALTNARLSELRFRTVVDQCPDAIFVVRQSVVRYANPAAEVLLDVRGGSIAGTGVETLRPAGAAHVLGDDTEHITLLDGSGQVISTATSMTEVQFDGHSVQVVFARDMSERLASKQLQSDFLAAVSHELRTPLTSVVGALGLLSRSGTDERERMLLDVASRNARRLGELIEDLLDLRTLETVDPTDVADVALVSVVSTAVASFADLAHRIKIHTDHAVWVRGDPRALARVIHHLVDNAVKFGGANQDIDVRVGIVADYACVHVCDRGPGVPRRYRETIFQGFSQGKAGLARPHGGFGVGLTLSRGIVEQHKGRMTLHDRDGGGATVTVCLPRIEPPAG